MANQFYVEGEQRGERVNDLFARVAPRYDLINDLQSFGLHRIWKRRLVKMANVHWGDPVLDVCCGTGDIAFGLARVAAKVTAIDFSEAMLGVARFRQATAEFYGLPGGAITFRQGDAMKLPFADNTFEAVTEIGRASCR